MHEGNYNERMKHLQASAEEDAMDVMMGENSIEIYEQLSPGRNYALEDSEGTVPLNYALL